MKKSKWWNKTMKKENEITRLKSVTSDIKIHLMI